MKVLGRERCEENGTNDPAPGRELGKAVLIRRRAKSITNQT
jgi:hypothetical protein